MTHPAAGGICTIMSLGPVSSPAMLPTDSAMAAMRLLDREMRVSPGCVPVAMAGRPVLRDTSCLDGDSYVLRTDSGLGFFYRRGQGIVVEHAIDADPAEESLWLDGSVHAAVACINGLMPIHASAVMHAGRIYAFTGPSGAGKSTLVAALAGHGLPMYGDDMLVLDVSDPAQVVCLPGHKRLKLTPEAIALTGAAAQEPVGADTGKFYASAGSQAVRDAALLAQPLPLAELIFLETGDAPAIVPITGGARIARLDDDHYTTAMFIRAKQRRRGDMFMLRARLARQVAMFSLARPRDLDRFAESVALAARHIHRHPGGSSGYESPVA